ncbi:MAG TPA: UDP-N-acetylmuramoyl-L-alanyl-D-glutamate--2,6-diaminopimelate ligase [Acidobacteriota bacterium]|nr:UDP-N-acetylmuramoyl-L-alanyl-D-glutamate--2,6-diaminopimelate ligase [Acidobacteriota bacterium]
MALATNGATERMGQQLRLDELLDGCAAKFVGNAAIDVTGISYDSRCVEPGHVFVAIPGFVHDGLEFVPEALRRGAVAIVSERPSSSLKDRAPACTWAQVDSTRSALAALACRWHGAPSEHLVVVGVTGTNGKTTVTALLEAIFADRAPVGRWSTTQVRIAGASSPTPRTTPEAPELQAAMAEMLDAGCWAAIIEVSSHALRLHRVAGTRFAAATFTNLSPDHLDFHHDMDDYLDAKAKLFETLPADAPAVLNAADPVAPRLAARSSGRTVTYGWAGEDGATPDYCLDRFDSRPTGSRLHLTTPTSAGCIETPLFGRANAENIGAAVATAMELGFSFDTVCKAASSFRGEPGRLQAVDAGQAFHVLVDFAHTPGAIQAALEAVRSIVDKGRVIVVFGCGGDRDRTKRALMGKIAANAADVAVVTSDNPRGEDPDAIIDEIVAGIGATPHADVHVEADRAKAIDLALSLAVPGDCVLIAGKGHETQQIFRDRVIPFDDVEVATATLAGRDTEVSR